MVAKHKLNYDDVWRKIHQRFNVDTVEQLPTDKIGYAVGYIHSLDAQYNRHTPVVLSLPGSGAYFVNVDEFNGNRVFIESLKDHQLIKTETARKLRCDLRIMKDAMADLAHRLELLDGNVGENVIEQPLKITLSA